MDKAFKDESLSPPDKLDIDAISVDVDAHMYEAASRAASESKQDSQRKLSLRESSTPKGGVKSPHWSTTPDGALLSQLTTHVYRKVLAPAKEGGLKEFFQDNCKKFHSITEGAFELEHMELFKIYEREVDKILSNFALEQNITSDELIEKIQSAAGQSVGAEKYFSVLLASASFNKFIQLMQNKAAEADEKISSIDSEKPNK